MGPVNCTGQWLAVVILLAIISAFHLAKTRLLDDQTDVLSKFVIKSPAGTGEIEIIKVHGSNFGPIYRWNTTRDVPCFALEPKWRSKRTQESPASTGILFVKNPKVGSSTAASVTLRIASRAGRDKNIPLCKNRVQHSVTSRMGYRYRDHRQSFLWSLVREPTSRVVSQFFHFQVSRQGYNATNDVFLRFLKQHRKYFTAFQLKYLAFDQNLTNPKEAIEEIFNQYNFIGVSERFDETIVVLQMLLGLEAADVMYLSSKASGGYDDGMFKNHCYLIQRSFVSQAMRQYFESSEWKEVIHWDAIFHDMANHALDLTIEQLGRENFERNLSTFLLLKDKVDRTCAETVRFPCSSTGRRARPRETDCMYDDMGCGFECMDSVIDQNNVP